MKTLAAIAIVLTVVCFSVFADTPSDVNDEKLTDEQRKQLLDEEAKAYMSNQ